MASIDDVLEEKDFEVEGMTQEDWDFVYSSTYQKLKKLLQEGKTVIFDCGNLKKSERQTARDIAESLNKKHKLIYIKIPELEIRNRWLKNQVTKERGHLEEVSLNKALEMFEEPGLDENLLVYDQPSPLEEWIEDNFRENIIK